MVIGAMSCGGGGGGGGGGASGGGGGRVVSSLTETWFFWSFYGPARGPGGTGLHPSKSASKDQQKTCREQAFNTLIWLTKFKAETCWKKAPNCPREQPRNRPSHGPRLRSSTWAASCSTGTPATSTA